MNGCARKQSRARRSNAPEQRLAAALRAQIEATPRGSTAVLCVGNPARGDDGFGPAVAELLRRKLKGILFDGGAAPENELPRLTGMEPRLVILVDAVHFAGRPGELRLLAADEVEGGGISTHSPSLSVLAQFVRDACAARVVVLAGQPSQVEIGAEMRGEMRAAARRAASILGRLLGHESIGRRN